MNSAQQNACISTWNDVYVNVAKNARFILLNRQIKSEIQKDNWTIKVDKIKKNKTKEKWVLQQLQRINKF